MSEKIEITLWDALGSEQQKKERGFRSMTYMVEPKCVNWINPTDGEKEIAVFTDKHIDCPMLAERHHCDGLGHPLDCGVHSYGCDFSSSKYKIAWIVECRSVHSDVYERIVKLEDKYDYVFTFDEDLLKRNPDKYILNHVGTSRVLDDHAKLYKKNKLFSLIASKKRYLEGHALRHTVADAFSDRFDIDLWGDAYRKIKQGWKVRGLAEYAFSIAIENSKHKNYFTEKIIDCFRTGTVPIYWGCAEVDDYFNSDGIIKFNDVDHLEEILKNLSFKDYHDRIESVKENFELAKEWVSMDDNFITRLNELELV